MNYARSCELLADVLRDAEPFAPPNAVEWNHRLTKSNRDCTMPCRAGIMRTPSKRRKEWERQVVGLKNWQEQYVGSKSNAQAQEDRRSRGENYEGHQGSCHAHPGGGDPDLTDWYAYESRLCSRSVGFVLLHLSMRIFGLHRARQLQLTQVR